MIEKALGILITVVIVIVCFWLLTIQEEERVSPMEDVSPLVMGAGEAYNLDLDTSMAVREAEALYRAQSVTVPVPPGVAVCDTPTQRPCPTSLYWLTVSPRGDMIFNIFPDGEVDVRVKVEIMDVSPTQDAPVLTNEVRVMSLGRIKWVSLLSLRKHPQAMSYRYMVPNLQIKPVYESASARKTAPIPVTVLALGGFVALILLAGAARVIV